MKFATKRFLSPENKKFVNEPKLSHRQDPREEYIDDLSQKLNEILNNKNLSDSEKIKLYNTLFKKYLASISKDESTTNNLSSTINISSSKDTAINLPSRKDKKKSKKNLLKII